MRKLCQHLTFNFQMYVCLLNFTPEILLNSMFPYGFVALFFFCPSLSSFAYWITPNSYILLWLALIGIERVLHFIHNKKLVSTNSVSFFSTFLSAHYALCSFKRVSQKQKYIFKLICSTIVNHYSKWLSYCAIKLGLV